MRAEMALSQPTIIPTYLDAYESAKMYNQAQINDNSVNPSPSFKPRWSDQDLELFKNGQTLMVTQMSIGRMFCSNNFQNNTVVIWICRAVHKSKILCFGRLFVPRWYAQRFWSRPRGK
jgi:hypothetical protein